MEEADVAYDAFISYSHAADDALAPAVHRALQTLARPWNRRRALEVFRDQTGLAVSPGLWTSICAGLDDSQHFVLLASPEAAASSWVNQEIERWAKLHSIDRLLPVLTAGEWIWDPRSGDFDGDRSTAVPPALRGMFEEEPRHLDLRWARTETDLDLRHSRFREAMAQLAAPMHNMSPQDLESSDVARFRQLVRLRRAVVAVLCALLLLVSVAGIVALQNAREARQQQALAEQEARRSLSLKLLAQGKVLANQQKTLGLLLTAEAADLAPREAWGSLVSGLAATPGLAKVFDFPPGARAGEALGAVDVEANTYASASHEGGQPVIRLWDLRSGKRTGKALAAGPLDSHLYGLSATELAFSPDGTLAVFYRCSSDGCLKGRSGIQLWDVETGAAVGRFLEDSAESSNLAFSHSGDRLAASAPDGAVHVWAVATQSLAATVSPPAPSEPTGLAFSADDKMLALSEKGDGHILVWHSARLQSSLPVDIPFPADRYPEAIAFGADGLLASRDNDGSVRLWLAEDGKSVGRLETGSTSVVNLAFGPDGILATADTSGSLQLWDVEQGVPVGSPRPSGLSGGGADVAFDQQGALVSTGPDIRVWDISRWGQVGKELYHHQSPVTALAASSDGVLASGDEGGVIRLWDLNSEQPLSQPLRQPGSVTALAFTTQGILASGDEDGIIRLWDVATGREIRGQFDGPIGTVRSLAFTSHGATLAAGYGLGRDQVRHGTQPIQIWDVSAGRVIHKLGGNLGRSVASVAFGPGGLFASAGVDRLVLWGVKTWVYKILDLRDAPYTAVAFSGDGQTLASSAAGSAGGDDQPVILWSLPSVRSLPSGHPPGEPLTAGPTRAKDKSFRSLAFIPNGSLLAGAGDGGVQLWELSLHEPVGGRLGSPARSIAVSPDGSNVIAGDADGTVVVYPATIQGWLGSVCAVVSRNLTRGEWDDYVGSDTPYVKTCSQYPAG
jgi:WD40 repeat protein